MPTIKASPRKTKTAAEPTPVKKQKAFPQIPPGVLIIGALALMAAIILITANTIAMFQGHLSFNKGDAAFYGNEITDPSFLGGPIKRVTPVTKRGDNPPKTTTPPQPTPTPTPTLTACEKIMIPAYFYPGNLWNQSIAANPKIGIMIMNPNSGSGTQRDTNYLNAVNNAKAAGIKVLGYVATTYGNRSTDKVKADIDNYNNWYSVDGIFLDEAATSESQVDYYKNLADYIHAQAPNQTVALNPGVYPNEAYAPFSDILMTFEGDYTTYKNITEIPAWAKNYPASKFVHMVYNTSTSTNMKDAVNLAAIRNAGHIYITNDTLSNPWDTLPSYLNEELTTTSAGCN